MIQQILIQAGYYFVAMLVGLFLIAIAMKGLFFPFMRVRLSFGKFVLVKCRAVNRDYFRVGKIEEGFLVYTAKKYDEKRLVIPSGEYIYKVCGTTWIDVDEATNSVCSPDYTTETGFDAVKYNNLYIRTLYRPTVADNQDRIIFGALLLIVILILGVAFFIYKNGYSLEFLTQKINELAQTVANSKGVIGG